MKDSLSVADMASLLGVTERQLRRWEEDGTGPKRIVENLEPGYPLESLLPWLRKHRPDVKLGAVARVIDARGRLALLEAWERRLCARYKFKSTEVLYEALRHADFHETGNGPSEPDNLEYWNLAAYAAFSGIIVRHKLSSEKLRELLADFRDRHDLGLAAKKESRVQQSLRKRSTRRWRRRCGKPSMTGRTCANCATISRSLTATSAQVQIATIFHTVTGSSLAG